MQCKSDLFYTAGVSAKQGTGCALSFATEAYAALNFRQYRTKIVR
ncbi:hypothetical protein RUMCAL_01773, partial [Ruminococcus callidus ATCC 27760]